MYLSSLLIFLFNLTLLTIGCQNQSDDDKNPIHTGPGENGNNHQDNNRESTQGPNEQAVYIGVIDTGVDVDHPAIHSLLGNPLEAQNGKDDDCNGYVDDVYGIDARFAVQGSKRSIEDCQGALPQGEAAASPHVRPGFEFEENDDGLRIIKGLNGGSHGTRMNRIIAYHVGRLGSEVERSIRIINCRIGDPSGPLASPENIFDLQNASRRTDLIQCLEYFTDLTRRGLNIAVINQSSGFPVDLKGSWRAISGGMPSSLAPVNVAKPYWLHTYTDADGNIRDGVEQRIRTLGELGVTYVTAAGNLLENNDQGEHRMYPATANLPNQISVASVHPETDQYWFDNDQALWGNGWAGTGYGQTTVHIAAPGGGIPNASISGAGTHKLTDAGKLVPVPEDEKRLYTPEDLKNDLGVDNLDEHNVQLAAADGIRVAGGDYEVNNGLFETSPAAAYVTAVVALLKAQDQTRTTEEIKQHLIETGRDVVSAPTDFGVFTEIHIQTASNKIVDAESALQGP
jgi:hypothetical protein